MNYAESLAKRLFEAVIPGARMVYREDQSRSVPDFHLCYADGKMGVVEVTASMDSSIVATNAAISDARKGGNKIEAHLCKKSWIVHPEPGTKIKDLRSNADSYLADIEQAGIERFFGPISRNNLAVARIYRDLGVFSGSVISSKGPGSILISFPTVGGCAGSNDACDAPTNEAWKSDNMTKLGLVNSNERHLAVYISPYNFLPWSALRDLAPPLLLPNLPPQITDVWLFTEGQQTEQCALWHAGPNKMWSNVGPVSLPQR